MHGFTMALAQEVAAKGVTVNTVSPGYIGTDMVRAIKPEILEKIVATIPVKRLGTPEEIGSVVAWLAGEDSGFTTGADFSCNGGSAHGLSACGTPHRKGPTGPFVVSEPGVASRLVVHGQGHVHHHRSQH